MTSNVELPQQLDEAVEKYYEQWGYQSKSEFVRDAIRAQLRRLKHSDNDEDPIPMDSTRPPTMLEINTEDLDDEQIAQITEGIDPSISIGLDTDDFDSEEIELFPDKDDD